MIYFFYNLFLFLIYPLFYGLSRFSSKGRNAFSQRKSDLKQLLSLDTKGRETVWLHAASVGELDQARALAQAIKKKNPNKFILQSVFSNSVTSKQLNDPHFDGTFLLPFDLPFAYDSILNKFFPKTLIVLAWDTWPNLLKQTKRSGAKTYLACASLSSDSGRKKGIVHSLTKASFYYLDGIFPSHEILVPEFKSLVSSSVEVSPLGDTRFDSVLNKIESSSPPESFVNFSKTFRSEIQNNPPVLFGSTYPVCESYLISFLEKNTSSKENYWIFPHKWENSRMEEVSEKLKRFGTVSKFSEIKDGSASYPNFLLVDEMGILAFAYRYAKLAYVGGGFHHRIHNTIEPAAFSLPLLTGPKITNAPEAIVMQKLGGLKRCGTKEEFHNNLNLLLSSSDLRSDLGTKNRKFVLENRGASEKICSRVFSNDFP
ncbi:3-deoxy-D-manno-octulosonic acid transferase [Leptospira idonii]|uniref:3-deoxy-D-manno-octulosonic acid transferase n=1 Tax=Leptospira idonii TaxID=1193500 RepID=A0A4R9M4F4_9LEPT|nr:glycosyltransferase N-terminal domain-containing protein [Leptospira idonii]TGN20129.1 3-deoxy-D-manno-octulosonic acid transferase [Leptospira idonii]